MRLLKVLLPVVLSALFVVGVVELYCQHQRQCIAETLRRDAERWKRIHAADAESDSLVNEIDSEAKRGSP